MGLQCFLRLFALGGVSRHQDEPTGLAVAVRRHRRTHLGREGIAALPEQRVFSISQGAGCQCSGEVGSDARMILRPGQVENSSLQQLARAGMAEHLDPLRVHRQKSALEINQSDGLGQDFHQPPVTLFAGAQRRRGVPQTHDRSKSRQKLSPDPVV